MKKGNLLSKQQLEDKSGAEITWFEYHQVSYMYYQLLSQGKICNEPLPIKGLLSAVYDILMDKDLKYPLAYQRAWHLELGRSIQTLCLFTRYCFDGI